MSGPRPIGGLVAPIVRRAVFVARYRAFIAKASEPAYQKRHITALYEIGILSADEAQLLIYEMKLEAA